MTVKKVAPGINFIVAALLAGFWISPSRANAQSAAVFTRTGDMIAHHAGHTATLLPDGKVLVAGGYTRSPSGSSVVTNTAELYDPTTGAWSVTGSLDKPRQDHTATVLPDGRILVAGGWDMGKWDYGYYSLSSAETYDPASGNWNSTANLNEPRFGHTATLLNNGQVLIAGGDGLFSAELYTPPILVPAPVLFSVSGDGQGQGFILHAITHQFVTPDNRAAAGETVEIYAAGLIDGAVIPPQLVIGGRIAEILSFGNAPGWTGVSRINVRVPDGIASGSAVTLRLTYLGRTSNEVTVAVQ
jgi:hypothetical protein